MLLQLKVFQTRAMQHRGLLLECKHPAQGIHPAQGGTCDSVEIAYVIAFMIAFVIAFVITFVIARVIAVVIAVVIAHVIAYIVGHVIAHESTRSCDRYVVDIRV